MHWKLERVASKTFSERKKNEQSQKEKMINDTALTIGKKSYSYLLPKNHTTKNKTLHYKYII